MFEKGGSQKKPAVAFGPELNGVGSWEWVGRDLVEELARYYRTTVFRADELPTADVLVLVKQSPSATWMEMLAQRAAVIYCPVDFYGSAAEIDDDAPVFRRCTRVLVHCERLRRYFEPYAPVVYIDHHVKFVAPLREEYRRTGYFLWVGVHTNLPPLAAWVNKNPLPGELRILMNLEIPGQVPSPGELGFLSGQRVTVAEWTPDRQAAWTAEARAALDVKGDDFRSRHKPPAKGIDFLASGIPLALGPGHSAIEHLNRLGFDVASPLDTNRWLSREYWEDVRRFGGALRELLSRERIGRRLKATIDEVLAERVETKRLPLISKVAS